MNPTLLMIEGDEKQEVGAIWTTIAAGAAKIGTRIGKRIAAGVRGKRAKRNSAKRAAAVRLQQQQEQQRAEIAHRAEVTRQAKNRNIMIAAAAAAAAIPVLFITLKK